MKLIAVFSLLALLQGCALVSGHQCARLHADVTYCLQPAEAMGDVSALQQVDFKFLQHNDTVLVEFEIEGNAFTMVVLSPLGQKLMQYKYMPPNMIRTGGMVSKFDPVLLTALIQLSVWPSQSVTSGLHGKFDWTATANHRLLRAEGQTLLDISSVGQPPAPDSLLIQLPFQQIELNIQTLRKTLPP